MKREVTLADLRRYEETFHEVLWQCDQVAGIHLANIEFDALGNPIAGAWYERIITSPSYQNTKPKKPISLKPWIVVPVWGAALIAGMIIARCLL